MSPLKIPGHQYPSRVLSGPNPKVLSPLATVQDSLRFL